MPHVTDYKFCSVENVSGKNIPAFALLRVTGRPGTADYSVAAPNADHQDGLLVNHDCDIPDKIDKHNGRGNATPDYPVQILYNPADGVPQAGETWGAGAGEWWLRKGHSGYVIYGVDIPGKTAWAAPADFAHSGEGEPPPLRVIPTAILSAQLPSGCADHSGAAAKDKCKLYYFHCRVQTFDDVCQEWVDAGCALGADILGRRLKLNNPYPVLFKAKAPHIQLEAIIVPVGEVPCVAGDGLYMVEREPVDSILVGPQIGALCGTAPPSGGGGPGSTGAVAGDDLSRQLIWHYGTTYYWDEAACAKLPIEGVIVSNVRGCPLTPGDWIDAHFNKMIPDTLLAGTAASGSSFGYCTPSYLFAPQKKSGDRVECCNGGGFHIFRYTGNCDEVSIENCGCIGGSGGGGSGGGGPCWCDGKPRADTFRISTFGPLTNGDCSNCGILPAFFDLAHGLNNCTWSSVTLPNPCGASMGATLVVNSDGSADIYIGAGDSRVALHYHKDSGFNCNGTNAGFNFVSGGSACASWPTTLTATPV
jgi:hypothetical protein